MGLLAGVDFGGTKCLAVAVDDEGRVVAEHRSPTPAGGDALVAATVDAVAALTARAGPVVAVGVGAPGLVDGDGVVHAGPHLPGVARLPLAARVGVELRLPVHVENDSTCAAWAEHVVGAARGVDDVVVAALGTGIGGGIVLGGVLQRGAHGFAGEIGHVIVDPDGLPCPCGRKGCWEQYASGTALGRLARDAVAAGRARRVVQLATTEAAVRGEHVTRAAAEGDDEARAIVAEFAWWLALGLANLAAVFDPHRFVLAGGLVAAGEVLLGPTRGAFAQLVELAEHRPPIDIVAAALGERAGAIGAAFLAMSTAAR